MNPKLPCIPVSLHHLRLARHEIIIPMLHISLPDKRLEIAPELHAVGRVHIYRLNLPSQSLILKQAVHHHKRIAEDNPVHPRGFVLVGAQNPVREIKLHIANEQIVDTNIQGISGFIAEWDGQTPLASVAGNSPLFASDEDLEKWEKQNPTVKGLGLPGDLLLWVGMQAAQQLGAMRFKLIGHHE